MTTVKKLEAMVTNATVLLDASRCCGPDGDAHLAAIQREVACEMILTAYRARTLLHEADLIEHEAASYHDTAKRFQRSADADVLYAKAAALVEGE